MLISCLEPSAAEQKKGAAQLSSAALRCEARNLAHVDLARGVPRIIGGLHAQPHLRAIPGNTYKGKLDDIFDIQEQVAQQIVEALKLKLSFKERVSLTKRQTVNAQAYDLYLRGQDYLYRFTKRNIERAIQLFEKAIELDARYAAAYAACSNAYGQLYWLFERHQKHHDRAQELSFKALMYDNNLAEAYAAMGMSYFIGGKFEEATASSRKAIELSPGDPVMLYNCTCFYSRLGEIDRALGALRQAIAAGYSNVEWAKQDPDLNPLRDNPDFQTLMEGLRRNRKAELPAN
jgi:tetratricopeptide (TPR) repeat protein